ncbi:glycosyltransferase family 2 protein [Solibaculum mannosilyticum]|uniref:Glycosyl transferase n=1 Tax=Solibaculum mannosilyticum TaxID=2780922 RepID=A0A7I8D579_9FIRM|nr:glycosyltransferase [Solibaculum mannosilyticum]BCI59804.1 glycosyl transferase [Solibaculum mannosilyticum]
MKVSIIVPVYNVEKYLPKCLDSLVSQTIDDFEILVVNDGSPDRSQDIIDEYSRRYPEKVVSLVKENGGQGSARNMALEIAKGEYIGFVDSDDWVDVTMYEKMYSVAREKNADIVVCDMLDHFEDGGTTYYDASVFQSPFEVTPSACNKLFRRELIGAIRFLGGLWYEDFDFTTKMLMRATNIQSIHEGFYHCHCRPGSTMHNDNAPKNLDMVTVLEDIRADIQTLPTPKKWKTVFDYLVLKHLLWTTINRVAAQKHPEREEVIQEMLRYVKRNVPSLSRCEGYHKFNKNQRIVMFLNYHGLYRVSKALLNVKKRV